MHSLYDALKFLFGHRVRVARLEWIVVENIKLGCELLSVQFDPAAFQLGNGQMRLFHLSVAGDDRHGSLDERNH